MEHQKENNKQPEKRRCNTTAYAHSGLSAVNSQCHVPVLLNHTDACTQTHNNVQECTHTHTHTHTHSSPLSSTSSRKTCTRRTRALIRTYFFSETKGRADCNIFLHFKKVASVKMINEGSWGRACILTLDCTRASRAATARTNAAFRRLFGGALRLLLLHRRGRHANYMPRQWLAMWNYYQRNNNIFNTTGVQSVWPDITSAWMGGKCCVPYTGVGW